MRPASGKAALIVNDHVGNVLKHGLPEHEPAWSLDGIEKRPRAAVWVCPHCHAVNPSDLEGCACCGCERPVGPGRGGRKEPAVMAGELGELTAETLAVIGRLSYGAIISGDYSESELRAFAQSRGYRHPNSWVRNRLWEQQNLSPAERLDRHRAWLNERRRLEGG